MKESTWTNISRSPRAKKKPNACQACQENHAQEKRLPAHGDTGVTLPLEAVVDSLQPLLQIRRVGSPDVLFVPRGSSLNQCFPNTRAAFDEAVHHSEDVPLVWFAKHVPHLSVMIANRGGHCTRETSHHLETYQVPKKTATAPQQNASGGTLV